MPTQYTLLGIKFANLSLSETITIIERFLAEKRFHYIVTPDMNRILWALRDAELKQVYTHADLTLSDGMAMVWASRILGCPLKERIACPDLVDAILKLSVQKGFRIFIFRGGEPPHTHEAIENIQKRYPGIHIVGMYTVPYDFDPCGESPLHTGLVELITEKKPHILLFSLGCPKEERWLWRTREKLKDIPLCLGIGGSMELYTARVRRAPPWMRRHSLEWLFRLIQDPRRLWKRYCIGGPKFMWIVLKAVWKRNNASIFL